jgi:hypothetical protein
MKHRWLWILAWFAALLVFNVLLHWTQNAGQNALYVFLEALGQITSLVQLLLSVVVVLGIALSRRKPMADR